MIFHVNCFPVMECKTHMQLFVLYQVEDMRTVIHNMGKFLSHRDVKVGKIKQQFDDSNINQYVIHRTSEYKF